MIARIHICAPDWNSQPRRFLRAQMRQPDREGVGRIRVWRFGQPEQRPHHERDLILSAPPRPTVACLIRLRRIFENRQAAFRRGENGRAARRAEQNRGLVTLHINDRFERATIRLVFANQFRQPIANRDQAG